MNTSQIKSFLNRHPKLRYFCIRVHNLFGGNRNIYGRGDISPSVRLKKTIFHERGRNNLIIIEENCILNHCTFQFFGNDNQVIIRKDCHLNHTMIWVEDNKNIVELGAKTSIHGKTEIACMEGTTVYIGNDCMFSSNIRLRSGDSHSIVNLNGNRINSSKDIHIGNHVWVGQDVFIGKGTYISDNSILGACAVVTKHFPEPNVVIAGNPATIVKNNINWKRERI